MTLTLSLALALAGCSGTSSGNETRGEQERLEAALDALREGAARIQVARLEGMDWPGIEQTALPTDPFSPTGQALMLARGPDGSLALYSLGPDLEDNGGRPWQPGAPQGDLVLPLRVLP